MNHDVWVGMGPNPDGPDLPLGLGMRLAQDPMALSTFGKMTNEQKNDLIAYIQAATTGDDVKQRITEALNRLRSGFKG